MFSNTIRLKEREGLLLLSLPLDSFGLAVFGLGPIFCSWVATVHSNIDSNI